MTIPPPPPLPNSAAGGGGVGGSGGQAKPSGYDDVGLNHGERGTVRYSDKTKPIAPDKRTYTHRALLLLLGGRGEERERERKEEEEGWWYSKGLLLLSLLIVGCALCIHAAIYYCYS